MIEVLDQILTALPVIASPGVTSQSEECEERGEVWWAGRGERVSESGKTCREESERTALCNRLSCTNFPGASLRATSLVSLVGVFTFTPAYTHTHTRRHTQGTLTKILISVSPLLFPFFFCLISPENCSKGKASVCQNVYVSVSQLAVKAPSASPWQRSGNNGETTPISTRLSTTKWVCVRVCACVHTLHYLHIW